jgi:hypothetical protein
MFSRSPSEPEQIEVPEPVPTSAPPAREAKVFQPSSFATRRRPEEPRGRRLVHLGTQQIPLPAAGRSQKNQIAEVDVYCNVDRMSEMFVGHGGNPTMEPLTRHHYPDEKVEQLGSVRVNPGMPSTTFAPGEPDRVRPA